MRNVCKICTAAPEVRQALERELSLPDGERPALRDLAKRCGFSRSGMSRHMRVCVGRLLLKKHREAAKLARNRRLVVLLPNAIITPVAYEFAAHKVLQPSEVLRSDAILGLKFKAAEIRNPSAMTADSAYRVEPQKACDHHLVPVDTNILRCESCGHQVENWQAVGFGFKDIDLPTS